MSRPASSGYALVTGGAGFIGSNLARRLLEQGHRVVILDDLSRAGVRRNADWLRDAFGNALEVRVRDVRDREALREAVRGADQVYHLAAQVAVTTSLDDPWTDFLVNAGGTLGLLQALRERPDPPPLVFASTNKVYGALTAFGTTVRGDRWVPEDPGLRERGVAEDQPLDFHSPYGCSKGAADQYVLDHARTFGLPACVFRMSCIYGPRQFGTEDQGWLAHFLLRSRAGEGVTIYGDGRQVRDALYVDDLVDAFLLARDHMPRLAGCAFNLGGGPSNTTSLLELLDRIEGLHGRRPEVRSADWRPGDQRWYVSDTARFTACTGWSPRVPLDDGLRRLDAWLATLAPRDAVVGLTEGAT